MRLDRVTITTEYDPDPDLSWLEQDSWNEPDASGENENYGRNRIATYGADWHMVGIIATAYLIVEEDGVEAPYLIDTSIWGVESDSDSADVQELGEEQLSELRYMLEQNGATAEFAEFPDEMVEWEMFA